MGELTAGVHSFTDRAKTFGSIASAAALLVAGLAAFRRGKSAARRRKTFLAANHSQRCRLGFHDLAGLQLAGSQSKRQLAENKKGGFMLRSIKQLYGDKLGASDGEIGHVKDFYFDDQNWAIRYLVADTGSWLPGRQVLISPHSLGRLDQAEKILRVNLTRKQIEDSPSIESHKPVSRQYEEEYYRYYGWPYLLAG